MSVPALLLTVNGKIYIYIFCFHPYILDLFQLNQIICGTGTVQNIHSSIILTIVQHIIDHRTKRCQTDTSGDKQKILSFQLILYRKMISIRPAHCDLIPNLQAVQIRSQLSASFNTKFLIFFIGRGGCNGKHSFTDSRCTKHCALSRHMLKKLSSIRCIYTKGFYIRSFLINAGDNSYLWDQSIQFVVFMAGTFTHAFSPPCFSKALITFTIFNASGHFSTQRPHPTQEYMPSLFAGK